MQDGWVIVKFKEEESSPTCKCSTKKGTIKIWRNYEGNFWGSPAYRVLGYADTFKEAKGIRKAGVEV